MKTIVAAVDFSDSTAGVIATASSLARVYGASLHILHVVEPEPTYTAYGFTPDEFPAVHVFQEEVRKRATARLDELLAHVSSDVTQATVHLIDGTPLHSVLEYVQQAHADVVVVGAHGHGAVAALLLGSVAEGLVRKAAVPTLVVPAPKTE